MQKQIQGRLRECIKTKKGARDSMGIQRYSIIYSSKTGNTKKLAEKIREVLPEEKL